MFKLVVLAIFVSLAHAASAKTLPTIFKKCKRDSNTLGDCLKIAVQDALPKLIYGQADFKIPKIEPLEIPSLTIGAGTGPVQLTQYFKNVKVSGIPTATIKNVKAKINEQEKRATFHFDTFVDKLIFQADYDMNGKLLFLPVTGKGKCNFELIGLSTYFESTGNVEVKDGVDYLIISDVTVKLNPTKLVYKFDNLFNGNKELGDQVNKILNENQKEVFADVQSGYEEFMAVIIKDMSNRIFSQVPLEDLFSK